MHLGRDRCDRGGDRGDVVRIGVGRRDRGDDGPDRRVDRGVECVFGEGRHRLGGDRCDCGGDRGGVIRRRVGGGGRGLYRRYRGGDRGRVEALIGGGRGRGIDGTDLGGDRGGGHRRRNFRRRLGCDGSDRGGDGGCDDRRRDSQRGGSRRRCDRGRDARGFRSPRGVGAGDGGGGDCDEFVGADAFGGRFGRHAADRRIHGRGVFGRGERRAGGGGDRCDRRIH